MKKKVISVLLAGILSVAMLAACGQDKEDNTAAESTQEEGTQEEETNAASEESEEGGTFTVGFDQEFPPMGFVDDNGEYTGFDLELAEEVANRLGLTFVAQPIAWDAKDMELESGTIDCIWNGFTINGREDLYTWTDPYLKNAQVFVVADDAITGKADLAGKIVEVQADSSAEKALKDDPELTDTFGNLQTVADYNTALMDLEQGSVDAIAMDKVVAAYQIEDRGDAFTILEETLQEEEYGVGFLKENTQLRDKVQAALEEMAKDGTLAEISTKWFGEDITIIGK